MGDDVEGLIIFLSDNQINKVVNIASSRNIRVHKFTHKGVLKSKIMVVEQKERYYKNLSKRLSSFLCN